MTVREEPYAIDQWRADAESGRLVEAFACGTAAVVTPIGQRRRRRRRASRSAAAAPGQTTERLLDALTAIQRGRAPDPHGWLQPIG